MNATKIFRKDRLAARDSIRRRLRRLRTPDNADAWHALGVALTNEGERAAALVAFHNALLLDRSHARSRVALGNLLFDSGQCERALNCFGMVEQVR